VARERNAPVIAAIQTEQTANRHLPAEHLTRTLASLASHRYGRPEDVAAAGRFLTSDEAEYITGSLVVVDGGFSCQSPRFAQDAEEFES
jgi:3-oxoacyl-[acyl-carrier protein] reductase